MGDNMSAIIALLLMQAAADEAKIYPSDNGFIVGASGGSCILKVEYESGIETTIFASKSNNVAFLFRQKSWNPVAEKRYIFRIDFGDEYYDIKTVAIEDGGFYAPLHPDFLNSYAKANGIEISWGKNSIASLNLLGSSKAIMSLRLCMEEQGIDLPASKDQVIPTPFTPSDPFDRSEPAALKYYLDDGYPVEANGSEGVVKTAVKVGANGRVLACEVLESSGSAILDEAACKGLRRSSFKAAKDRAGQPIEAVIERSVRFEDPSKTVLPD